MRSHTRHNTHTCCRCQQNNLGAEGVSLEFRHICTHLLWYCSNTNAKLLHEVIVCVGNFTYKNKLNQVKSSVQTVVVLLLLLLFFVRIMLLSHELLTNFLNFPHRKLSTAASNPRFCNSWVCYRSHTTANRPSPASSSPLLSLAVMTTTPTSWLLKWRRTAQCWLCTSTWVVLISLTISFRLFLCWQSQVDTACYLRKARLYCEKWNYYLLFLQSELQSRKDSAGNPQKGEVVSGSLKYLWSFSSSVLTNITTCAVARSCNWSLQPPLLRQSGPR